jgi:hypothetical protein
MPMNVSPDPIVTQNLFNLDGATFGFFDIIVIDKYYYINFASKHQIAKSSTIALVAFK